MPHGCAPCATGLTCWCTPTVSATFQLSAALDFVERCYTYKKSAHKSFPCHTYKKKGLKANLKPYCLPHIFKIKTNRSLWQRRLPPSGKFALLHRTNPSRPLHSSHRRCKIPSGPPGSGFVFADPEFRMVEHLRSFRCLNTRADHRVSGYKGLSYRPLHERFGVANPDL
jgi:hypothetical protein